MLIQSIAIKLMIPTARVDLLHREKKIQDLKGANSITKDEERCLRERSQNFLLQLFQQLKQRQPDNLEILKIERCCLLMKYCIQTNN